MKFNRGYKELDSVLNALCEKWSNPVKNIAEYVNLSVENTRLILDKLVLDGNAARREAQVVDKKGEILNRPVDKFYYGITHAGKVKIEKGGYSKENKLLTQHAKAKQWWNVTKSIAAIVSSVALLYIAYMDSPLSSYKNEQKKIIDTQSNEIDKLKQELNILKGNKFNLSPPQFKSN